jgi:hypothetical protein
MVIGLGPFNMTNGGVFVAGGVLSEAMNVVLRAVLPAPNGNEREVSAPEAE